jgi:hypothetical protein
MNGFCSLLGAAAVWLGLCAPPHPGDFDPATFGYSETTAGRGLVAEAIAKVNVIVDPRDHLAIVPGWDKSKWSSDSVPVHLIGNGASASEMIFVPRGCRCIVITVPAMQAWLADASDAAKGDMAVDAVSTLAFMLLHELGHIAHGDHGRAFAPLPTQSSDTNLVLTTEKCREFAADAWAADHVRRAFTPGHPGFFSSINVQFALGAIGWNLARRRLIDNFGATVLRDPRVLFDQGYSHPNFEFRFLVANELVSDTSAAKALREEFESMRAVPAGEKCPAAC